MKKANRKKTFKISENVSESWSNILVFHWLKLLQQFTSVTDEIQAPWHDVQPIYMILDEFPDVLLSSYTKQLVFSCKHHISSSLSLCMYCSCCLNALPLLFNHCYLSLKNYFSYFLAQKYLLLPLFPTLVWVKSFSSCNYLPVMIS